MIFITKFNENIFNINLYFIILIKLALTYLYFIFKFKNQAQLISFKALIYLNIQNYY